jgi:D-glycero-alpha-D-manno-heptose 1-phosphate guanylyltransferase
MPIKEAIILAGGLGSRLREAVPDLPKCMAPVGGRPFLFHVINYLRLQGIEKIIFSLGYKHEIIQQWLSSQFSRLRYECVVENEPLGTGGAIQLACQYAHTNDVLIANGDTLFRFHLANLAAQHFRKNAACTLALKPMENFDRYGAVRLDDTNIVIGFQEKKFYQQGLINGGVYILNKKNFLDRNLPGKFSFENEYLQTAVSEGKLAGIIQNEYFIDIGIPDDFKKAQKDLEHVPLNLAAVDSHWSLFLDRDGVINVDKPGSYIFNPGEFRFLDNTSIFAKLATKFRRVVVVTNQRGVGRGLMTEDDLNAIHQKMSAGITDAGGRLDGIYYCTAIDNTDPFRKPNPGMALRAKTDFPDIVLARSIIVGNNLSDMQFGRNAGMYTVFLRTTNREIGPDHPDIDLAFDSLTDFAKAL